MLNDMASMNRALFSTITLLIAACSQSSDNKNLNNKVLSISNGSLSNKILGVWTDGNTQNAAFSISRDSILYVKDMTSYKYSLTGDSIKIIYPDNVILGKIGFLGDTLVINSFAESSKFWKFEN